MGTLLYARGVYIHRSLRRGQPRRARAGRERPPRVPAGRRRGDRDQLLRRESRETRAARAGRAHGGDQPPRRRDRARRGGRHGGRARRDRPARHPHGAVGPHEPRGGARRSTRGRSAGWSTAASTASASRPSATRPRSTPRCAPAAPSRPSLPLVCQMTVDREGVGLYGTRPEDFGARLDAWGADVIGVNCSVGPQAMLGVVEKLVAVDLEARLRPAQRRPAARGGRSHDVPVHARVPREGRAPLPRCRRATARRLLRHDARPHPRARQGRPPRRRLVARRGPFTARDRPGDRRRDAARGDDPAARRALARSDARSPRGAARSCSSSCRRAAATSDR